MEKLDQLRKRQVEITERQKHIISEADSTNGGVASEAQWAELGRLEKEYKENMTEIQKLDEQKALRESISGREDVIPQRQTQPSVPGKPTGKSEDEDKKAKDPKFGFETPREFLQTVMVASVSGRIDPRLKTLTVANDKLTPWMAVGSDEQMEGSLPYGGFLVPRGFSMDVLQVASEADPLAGRVRMLPMERPQLDLNARVDKNHSTSVSGGLVVYRRHETDTVSATRIEFEKVSLTANSLFGLAYATEEILTDSPATFAALLADGFADEFRSKLLDERINGTGAGEFEGILTSPALISVAKETGQTADTIVYENVIKMRARCWRYENAVWLANHDTTPQLMLLNQTIGTGGTPIWQPSAREDRPDVLLGRPLFFTEYSPTVGDANDICCVNPREYLEGTYQPLQSAESIHVRFVNHERAFKFWMRNDGRGWWRSALTPKNGSTLSPFVGLAVRA